MGNKLIKKCQQRVVAKTQQGYPFNKKISAIIFIYELIETNKKTLHSGITCCQSATFNNF